jgi:hypothetical protein
MDDVQPAGEPVPQLPDYPGWIVGIEDRQVRDCVEQLYRDASETQRRHESNLRLLSSLRSQCTVQQERIDRLQRRLTIAVAAVGGGLAVIGLVALLFAYYPSLGVPAAAFLIVLLGRAAFPALLDLLRAQLSRRGSAGF